MAPQLHLGLSLWLLCVLIPTLRAAQTKHCRMSDYRKPTGICGNSLSELLSLVCEGRGFFEPFGKRSEVMGPQATDSEPLTSDELPLGGPFVSKANALQMLDKRGETIVLNGVTYRTGVTCECCVNNCSWRELDQYCLLPAKKRSGGPLSQLYNRNSMNALYRFRTKSMV